MTVSIAPSERDERGATATEYGLLIGFIAIALVLGVGLFGSALGSYFTTLATWIGTVI